MRASKQDNDAYNRAWRKYDRANKRAFLLGYSARLGCLDCGENNPRVLEFDHREQYKKFLAVSSMVSFSYSFERLIEEIEKCDVRCANCHKIRTGRQLGWYESFGSWLS